MKHVIGKAWYLWALVWAMALAPLLAQAAGAGAVDFDGVRYVHRWSKDGQNEFTPKDEADLSRWTDMVTINVFDKVTDGEQLAAVANQIVGNYQANGKILRTQSVPRTETKPAEHFMGAVLARKDVIEVVFARVLLVNGTGVVIVRSHRVYGQKVGNEMSAWLEKNGARNEQVLMAWKGLPSVADLRKLPQSAR